MQKKRLKKVKYFDYSLLFVIIFLLGFGLVMIYSTSSYSAQIKFNDAEYFFKKQLFAEALGFAGMYIVYRIDYHIWVKHAFILYVISMILIVLVKSPLGYSAYGASRWIQVGPLSIQPAEVAKISLIFACTAAVNRMDKNAKKFKAIFIHIFLGAVLAGMIFLITNNMSSAIIVMGIAVVISFVVYPKYNIYLAAAGLVGVMVAGVRAWAKNAQLSADANFRFERILAWVNPEKFADDTGFQTVQSLYAIGSGGLFGKGLGKSLQKLGFIPEAQNDMIFSVICEELGLFGALCILIVFGIMLWRFVYIATNAPDLTGSLLVVGVFAHIAIQVVLNVAVVTNLIPNTGISLPFISYGGTSVLFLMAEMGIVLNVSRHIKMEI